MPALFLCKTSIIPQKTTSTSAWGSCQQASPSSQIRYLSTLQHNILENLTRANGLSVILCRRSRRVLS